MQEKIIADDVRAFAMSGSVTFKAVTISFYGGPQANCGSILYRYDTYAKTQGALEIVKGWIDNDTPLQILQDEEGNSTIRPVHEHRIS